MSNADRGIEPEIVIEAPRRGIGTPVAERLQAELDSCPDVAFAHLCEVTVLGRPEGPMPSLFVWLVPEAVASLRAALNLVSEAVARALPEDEHLDVLILNSVPELLPQVERNGLLLVERDSEERRRALDAARNVPTDDPPGRDDREP